MVASGWHLVWPMRQFVKVDGNKAPIRPNISTVATSIQILSSNADNLVASDSREGFLQLTLKVFGRNNVPSDDDLVYSVYDSNHVKLFDQQLSLQGTELKTVAISLKPPPGWLDSCGMCTSFELIQMIPAVYKLLTVSAFFQVMPTS